MTTALITGVVGQDGAYLSRHLLSEGYRVIGTMPAIEPPSGFIEAYLSGVDLRVVDLTNQDAMLRLLEEEHPDEIFNLAAISSVAVSWQAPVEVALVNGVAVLQLLEAVRRLQGSHGYWPRILQASSAEIFGTPVTLPQDESHPIRPTNPYAVAKAFAHLSAINYREAYGMFVSTAILFNHESPLRPPSFVTRKITTAAVSIAAGRQDRLVLGNLDIRRDWSSARDVTRAMAGVLRVGHPDDFVLASGTSSELREFVHAAFEAAGVDEYATRYSTDPSLARPTDVPEMRGAPARATRLLGWHPTTDLRGIVGEMVSVDRLRLESGVEHDPGYLGRPA